MKVEDRKYARINVEFDSNLKVQKIAEVEGDELTIASLIGAMIHSLIENGFDRDLLEYTILKELKDSKKQQKNIEIKEIHISKDNEDEFKNLLEKLLKGDK